MQIANGLKLEDLNVEWNVSAWDAWNVRDEKRINSICQLYRPIRKMAAILFFFYMHLLASLWTKDSFELQAHKRG